MRASFKLFGPVGANVRIGRENTVRMKRALQRLGFYESPSDGIDHIADSAMLDGIRAFQKANGLAAYGEA